MTTILLKGGYETEDPRLGRVPEFDEASREYKIRDLLEMMGARPPRSNTWVPGKSLDQGQTSACVGFSCTHRVAGYPVPTEGLTYNDAQTLYKRAQQLDEWAGENYEGSSVLGGMKALAEQKRIVEYRWVGAGSQRVIDDVVETLGYVGGIVFGLPWTNSMFHPRPSGLLEVDTSSMAGGHAIHAMAIWLGARLQGESRTYDVVGLQNSWGPSFGVKLWGQPGMCLIKLEDLEKLLKLQGEGAVPLEKEIIPEKKVCPTCKRPL